LGRIERFCPKSLEFVNQLVNFAKRKMKKEFKRQVTVYGDYFMKDYFKNKKKAEDHG
jgi:hypothetical protein